jgi:threonine dehydrogenase-like Zn-dependent dehydrogenase
MRDLHMYEGRTPIKPGKVLGHETLGVVEKTGDAVVSIKEGYRVAITFNVA